MPRLTRRQLLSACAAVPLAAAATSVASAIDPIERNGTPKFKFSLAAYSYRSLLQGKNAKLTMADFIDDCAKMQLEGTELTSYYFPKSPTAEYLRGLRRQCFRLGLDVSGTAVGNDFGQDDPAQQRQQIDTLKQWCRDAEILGAPVIRVFAGRIRGDEAKSRAQMVEGLQECCETAAQHGVHLALENHGGPTSTADGLLQLVKAVDSPWFGVNLDTGNFHTKDIYGDLAKAAPYAINVQVKVVVSGPDKKKRPADFARIADILRNVNYRGYVVLEYEEAGDPRQACPPVMKELRKAFA